MKNSIQPVCDNMFERYYEFVPEMDFETVEQCSKDIAVVIVANIDRWYYGISTKQFYELP